MAKKPARKRQFNLRRVRVNGTVGIGALASKDVGIGVVSAATVGTCRFMSVDCSYTWSDIAALIDDALEFGIAHSDYTAAEIEECLEASGSMDIGDKVAQEQANRLVRSIGTMSPEGDANVDGGTKFDGGRRVKTKLNWLMSIGDTLTYWVRNGSDTIYTTGSGLTILGDLWIKPSV